MKNTLKNVILASAAAMILSMGFSTTAYADSEWPDGFDLGDTVVTMDQGTTREVWMWAKQDYSYFMGDHTSDATYLECSFKGGTENVVIHIGADEQAKNVFFYLYDQDMARTDSYASIEVYVRNAAPAAEDTQVAALKSFEGNNADFNAYYYYENYPDLQAAFGKNANALLAHYNSFGKTENRIAGRLK